LLRARKKTICSKNILPLEKCIAKTFTNSQHKIIPGITVEDHCKIVGNVAKSLLNLYPDKLRNILFPDGSELVAAAHDIGKISPSFQEKIYRKAIRQIDSPDKIRYNTGSGIMKVPIP